MKVICRFTLTMMIESNNNLLILTVEKKVDHFYRLMKLFYCPYCKKFHVILYEYLGGLHA